MGDVDSKTLLEELNERFNVKTDKQSGFGEYTQETQKLSYSPDNPYGHQYALISSQTKDVATQGWKVTDDPQIVLGDIDNEKTLRLYQIDYGLLVNCCGMAQNDEMWIPVFNVLWRKFKGELRMTSNMGGKERFFQAFMQPKSTSRPGFSFLRKKSKKKKTTADYVFDQGDDDDGGGMF